jgi:hypothetical protein
MRKLDLPAERAEDGASNEEAVSGYNTGIHESASEDEETLEPVKRFPVEH